VKNCVFYVVDRKDKGASSVVRKWRIGWQRSK